MAALGVLLLLVTLILPPLTWLNYDNPLVGDARANLNDRALANAQITIPVRRGSSGTQATDALQLAEYHYRLGDIAALFDLELPLPGVYTRREFQVTPRQLSEIPPANETPPYRALITYEEDIEVPLRDLLSESELFLPRPALHESAGASLELADLLDLLGIAIPVADLLAKTDSTLPLTEENAGESEITLAELANLAGVDLPSEAAETLINLATLFPIAAIDLPLETLPGQHLNLPLSELVKLGKLDWTEETWATIAGLDLSVANLLEEARIAVPLEPATVRRSALGLLDDYLLRTPHAYALSLTLALFTTLLTLLLPVFGRRWRFWPAILCGLLTLIWLPFLLRAENAEFWGIETILRNLAPGYWLAWLAMLIIGASRIWNWTRTNPEQGSAASPN